MNLVEKLNAIQCELIAPKSLNNTFGKFMYRNCEEILKALKPLMEKYKVAVVLYDDLQLIGDRFYVKATATLADCESSEKVSSTAFAREANDKKGMDESQITGSCASYARKNALSGLFAIDSEKDPDARGSKGDEPEMTQHLAEETQARAKMISDLTFARGDDYIEKLLAVRKVDSVDKIPTDYLRKCWDRYCAVSEEQA